MTADHRASEGGPFTKDQPHRPGGIGMELERAVPADPAEVSEQESFRPAEAAPSRREGRARATFLLKNRQIVFLDRLSADIRSRSGTIVKRSDVVRALIDHLADQPLDLSSVLSVADLRRQIREIGAPAKRRETPTENGAVPSRGKEKK